MSDRERSITGERKKGEQRPLEYHDAGNVIRMLPPIPLYALSKERERGREGERDGKGCAPAFDSSVVAVRRGCVRADGCMYIIRDSKTDDDDDDVLDMLSVMDAEKEHGEIRREAAAHPCPVQGVS